MHDGECGSGLPGDYTEDVLESLTVGIAVLDRSFRICRWNRFMASITQKTRENVIGRPYFEVFPEQLGSGLARTLQEVIETGETREIRNFKHQDRNKRTYVTRKKICPLKRLDGTVTGVIIVSEDVTDKVLLGEELRRLEKLRAVGEFAARIAHEINNPIGVISAYAEHLAESIEQDPTCIQSHVQGLRAIQEEAERCSGIIRNILAFSREAEAKLVPVDLPKLLDSVLFLIEKSAENHGVSIEKDYDSSLSVVLGDPDQLRQVFFNLAINAIQAMPDGGALTVRIRREPPVALLAGDDHHSDGRFRDLGIPEREEQHVAVEFSDTGCGVPEQHLNDIFKPFFSTKATGTGLGLSVSEGIVRNHSGTITVKSEVGRGSTFTVRLPVGEL